jgi:outer membrane protein OmpA-like peptidoglycan-associated protein
MSRSAQREGTPVHRYCHVGRAMAIAALAVLLNACATQTGTVVLLPEKDGKDAAVTVKQSDGQVVLSEPYAAARLTTAGPQAYKSNPDEVQALFGAALAAQPSRPVQFTLFFVEGKDDLTEESGREVTAVFAEIAKRPVPDVVVIGHTDAVGTHQVNDPLSQQRAEVIRAGLIRNGIAPENITAVGRGKRELLVPTADGVAEPRNRRVEIIVR